MVGRTVESFLEEVPEKEGLETIYQREEEYADVLGNIEYGIAQHYLSNPEVTDKDVTKALKNFKDNYDREFDENSLEQAIQTSACKGLKDFTREKKISRHEFLLVIDYILWSISNREWVPDERAYLMWICNFFELLSREEKEEYEGFYRMFGDIFGVSEEQISLAKGDPLKISNEVEKRLSIRSGDMPCPCGSGKRYRECCGKKTERES